jgi:hypothetical protein
MMTEYFNKMQSLGEEMAAAGLRLDDDELVEYILTGLDFEYNPIVSSVLARSKSLTLSELYAQLLAFETRLKLMGQRLNASSVNMAGRGRSGFGRGFGRGGNRGRGQPAGRGRGGNHGAGAGQRGGGQRCNFNNSHDNRPPCQICYKPGHTAEWCWHRFEEAYEPEQKQVAAATTSYNVDPNWYTDSRATDHITTELDKLTIHNKYQGGEQVHTANGASMKISHLGKSIIRTPYRHLLLNKVLHVPSTTKNLISVHRFTSDNNVFIEFHP